MTNHVIVITRQLKEYALLIRLHRPIGSLLLLWPTLWALWLANHGIPELRILCIFVAGVFIMRSAGCVINDIADRKIDPHVTRTRDRPLAAGRIALKEAIILFTVLCLIALLLVLQLNYHTILLSFIGLILAIIYPFTKRFTYWPQLFLGAAYAWGVPMAFSALNQPLNLQCWLIYLSAVLWPLAYDTEYAMVDRPDDLLIGVKSTAILFRQFDHIIIAVIQCVVIGLLVYIGYIEKLNYYFYIGLVIAVILFIYQQKLIKNREPQQCFKAFLNNNWVGLVIFLGIFAAQIVT